MTLQEAMNYRGENPATLSDKLAVQEVRDAVRYAIARMQRAQEQSNREKHQCGAGRKG